MKRKNKLFVNYVLITIFLYLMSISYFCALFLTKSTNILYIVFSIILFIIGSTTLCLSIREYKQYKDNIQFGTKLKATIVFKYKNGIGRYDYFVTYSLKEKPITAILQNGFLYKNFNIGDVINISIYEDEVICIEERF